MFAFLVLLLFCILMIIKLQHALRSPRFDRRSHIMLINVLKGVRIISTYYMLTKGDCRPHVYCDENVTYGLRQPWALLLNFNSIPYLHRSIPPTLSL